MSLLRNCTFYQDMTFNHMLYLANDVLLSCSESCNVLQLPNQSSDWNSEVLLQQYQYRQTKSKTT